MTLDDLAAFGANVEEGLARCMGMEEFYLRLAETIKTEKGFGELQEAIVAGDLDAAFAASHALKGVLANLSLTPLYEPVSEMCELLRARTEMDYAPLLENVMVQYERYCAL